LNRQEGDDRFLLCRIGSCIGGLAVKDVRETMRPLPIEPLSGAPPFVLGLAIVRGSPTPVIDAGRLLGSSASSPTRFISLKLEERAAVLAVDAVLDIRVLPKGILREIPPLLRDADQRLVSVIGALDAELLVVLEAARLVPDSLWSSIKLEKAPA
jgi:purine-binding chemotaxis protein CheW